MAGKQRYDKYKSLGLCVCCGKTSRKNRVHCHKCASGSRPRCWEKESRDADKCLRCGNSNGKVGRRLCKSCQDKQVSWKRDARTSWKNKVYSHYGGKCACCKEPTLLFLTIDHVLGDGKKDRELSQSYKFYKQIVDRNFPPTYRILCYNCNCGRSRNGGTCPHGNGI